MTVKDTQRNTVLKKKTNNEGNCILETEEILYGRLTIQKEGYLLIKEEITP